MSGKNLSAVLHGKGDLRLEERDIPEPGPGEVQIRILTVGICGTDIARWTKGGPFKEVPKVIGHEPCGIVSKLGEGVEHLKIGDRVSMELPVSCSQCLHCRSGRYNLCLKISRGATTGAMARYRVHVARQCYKLPDSITDEEAIMMEPLAVALHAGRRAGVRLGHKVLVCGAGSMGLASLLSARAMGATEVCVTDISEYRLSVAKKMGATYTVHVDTEDSKATAERVTSVMGDRPDVTIECSGAVPSLQAAIYATRSGGVLMNISNFPPMVNLPMGDAFIREIDIRSTLRFVNTFPTAIAILASGSVDVKPMITHRFKLEQVQEAFETARARRDGSGADALKVLVHCNEDWDPECRHGNGNKE